MVKEIKFLGFKVFDLARLDFDTHRSLPYKHQMMREMSEQFIIMSLFIEFFQIVLILHAVMLREL